MSDERKFIVWDVFGNAGGSVRILATYPFRQRADADAHAARVKGGYVLRAVSASPSRAVLTYAEGDAKPATVPVPVPVVIPPVPDTLPPVPTVRFSTFATG